MSVSTAPETDRAPSSHELISADVPWELIVWNDPVNLMSYVSYVFQSYFGYSEAKASKLMMQVHQEGKSAVASGAKEKMEAHVVAMHGFGLWATVQKGGGRG
ncbi:ATP-dependent Clp protease adaptor protein ClpS [Arthrobacter silviterrae]|uniref:ATP-dependent Clp protease adapter protein ClpS n=1 Tax=Arthrobacter silviterrae TaxID=2026658 RepID=A0ABX0D7N9_9MICC|nr:ATP-dependent Clp protease adapter ClpS [Arthrobacter silviterrae]MDQ0276929.1 ATP-dependent Clp protease adaptor protein ClpS [Arthrobacter silviterrae]NGN82718.1 ATP-dependent Clp protease adapter ClpS [Arthrobacter silviterrae]